MPSPQRNRSCENFLYSFKAGLAAGGATCGASGPRSAAVRALLGDAYQLTRTYIQARLTSLVPDGMMIEDDQNDRTVMADGDARMNRPGVVQPTSWSVRDFKAIDFAETPLTGLVALAGANSSGKSSLLQSLLLVAQTGDQEVTLNGNLVRLGVPRDAVKSGKPSLAIACTARTRSGAKSVEWNVELSLRPTTDGLKISECAVTRDGAPMFFASDARVTERAHTQVDSDRAHGDTILRVREVDGDPAPAHTYVTFNGILPVALHPRVDGKTTLRELRRTFSRANLKNHEVANQFTELVFANFYRTQVEREAGALSDAARAVVGGSLFLEESSSALSNADIEILLRALADRVEDGTWQPIPIRPGIANAYRRLPARYVSLTIPAMSTAFNALLVANDVLTSIAQSVRYLGPLREEPQVVSKIGPRSRTTPVGVRGELTAELLSTRTQPVKYHDWEGNKHSSDLTTAVGMWASYLGIGDAVAVEDQGKLGRGLRVTVNGVDRDLTMVGVGASQLLPVIAIILDAPARSLVLLEQPELHLHPSVQSRLGDFLLFARRDLGIIVETHSEYLITRVRRRVADRRVSRRRVHVLFAEPLEEGTEVRELRMTDLGNLDEWPKGFFDSQEQDSRAIVRAITDRRKKSEA